MKVAIIGGGLAGTACAYMLKRGGAEVVIYEAGESLASGASGNPVGICSPRLSAHRNPHSDFYVAGFASVVSTLRGIEGVDWNPCGTLYLINNEKTEQRFPQTLKNWRWDSDHMRILDAREAAGIAGVEINRDALYLPDAGCVSPYKLCHAYAKDVQVKLNSKIDNIADIDADVVILASAIGVQSFPETSYLPLTTVRGQITQVKETKNTASLKCNLYYGGYFLPSIEGVHVMGATFQRGLDHDDAQEEDDKDNIEKLADNLPVLAKGLEIVGQRASVRTATKDYFPIVGSVPGHKNLYVSVGHGSHGAISSLISATLLADMILDRPRALPADVQRALSADRFL